MKAAKFSSQSSYLYFLKKALLPAAAEVTVYYYVAIYIVCTFTYFCNEKIHTVESVDFGKDQHALAVAGRVCAFSRRRHSWNLALACSVPLRGLTPTIDAWNSELTQGAIAAAAVGFQHYVMAAEIADSSSESQGLSELNCSEDHALHCLHY